MIKYTKLKFNKNVLLLLLLFCFLDFLLNTYSYLAEHQRNAKRSWGNAGLSRNANDLLS
jgi:hypothetical protein